MDLLWCFIILGCIYSAVGTVPDLQTKKKKIYPTLT